MTPMLVVIVGSAAIVAAVAILWHFREPPQLIEPERPVTETDVLSLLATHARCCSQGETKIKALLSHYVTRVDRDDVLRAYVERSELGHYVADHLRHLLATEEFRARLVLIMREEWQRPPAFMTGQHATAGIVDAALVTKDLMHHTPTHVAAPKSPRPTVKTYAKLPKSAPKRGRR